MTQKSSPISFIRHHRLSYIAMAVMLLVCLISCATTTPNTDPINGWQASTPEHQGMQSQNLIEMMTYIQQKDIAINSITIIRNGYLVLDAYFYPFKKNAKHILKSCSKSITSAAFGIAMDKGYINSLDQRVIDFFPDKQIALLDHRKRAMTLKHLLTMSSGLSTEDSYAYRWRGLNEMLKHEDWVQWVLDRPMAHTPGTRFDYSNCVTFLLSAIIQRVTQMTTHDLIKQFLFAPLNISDAEWASSPNGISLGYDQIWMTPHDMAKFGWLYLNHGRCGGRQIVAQKWIKDSTQKHIDATLFNGYGYQWWVTPGKYYAAVGNEGQYIFVVPAKNMVVAITSNLKDRDFFQPKHLLNQFIIPAVAGDAPLPVDLEKAARLKALVHNVSEPVPYIWRTKSEGMAQNGVFKRTAPPAFTITYPPGCRKIEVIPGLSREIMSMRTLNKMRFKAFMADGLNINGLEEFGPQIWMPGLKKNPKISDIEIISNKKIILKDNTAAYRVDIKFKFRDFFWDQVVVVARKQDRLVYITASGWSGFGVGDGIKIAESLRFN